MVGVDVIIDTPRLRLRTAKPICSIIQSNNNCGGGGGDNDNDDNDDDDDDFEILYKTVFSDPDVMSKAFYNEPMTRTDAIQFYQDHFDITTMTTTTTTTATTSSPRSKLGVLVEKSTNNIIGFSGLLSTTVLRTSKSTNTISNDDDDDDEIIRSAKQQQQQQSQQPQTPQECDDDNNKQNDNEEEEENDRRDHHDCDDKDDDDYDYDYELGFVLSRDYWGKGYATEIGIGQVQYGFHTLRLSRIVAVVRSDNVASTHALQKTGLQYYKTMQTTDGRGVRDVWMISSQQQNGNDDNDDDGD